ncbi:MAG: EboA domain-containing protein [Planctomycetes bacterium]|nr:EboA domain-containing protein [Planctomycetota bacterium]
MQSPPADLTECLGPEIRAKLTALQAEIDADRARLPVVFPGLPRRLGRHPVGGGRSALAAGTIDLDAFRVCDLGAAWLLLAVGASDDELRDLMAHGDLEERAMLLRAMHVLPLGAVTVEFLGEAQRTNVVLHVEAAVCDGDLVARAIGQPGFDLEVANKLILKYGFLGLPLERAIGLEQHANIELSRMLQDLATEREAAGRAVWRDTWRLSGRAPTAGTAARLVGGLEHGDDGVRAAAAEGLFALGRPDLAQFAAERLPREPRGEIRALLERLTNA